MSRSKILLYQTQGFASAPTQTHGGVNAQQVGDGVKIGIDRYRLHPRRFADDRRQHEPRHQRQRLLRPQQHQRQRDADLHAGRRFLAQRERLSLRSLQRSGRAGLPGPSQRYDLAGRTAATDPNPVRLEVDAVGTGFGAKSGRRTTTRASTSRSAAISTRPTTSPRSRASARR